ncbi:FAD-dependent monooxygenase [Streptomyces sp. NPDC006668]|uniref:FAD-dependent monooxygenase n=1 Tax=Streptomyces sp. NPDC006668 TaxID=3156903 RepID=UPI0033DCCE6A
MTRPPHRTLTPSSSCSTNAPPGLAPVIDLAWSSSRCRGHHRVADHYRSGRVLLAGDAAQCTAPPPGRG